MTAYEDQHDLVAHNIYSTISMILAKNKCEVVNIDFETGILDIHGENEETIRVCQNDIQRVFANYLFD